MQKISLKQTIAVFILYVIGIGYIQVDQLFVPKQLRFPILLLVFIGIFTISFLYIKTDKPFALSNRLAGLLLIIVIPLYLVQDLMINHNYTLSPIIVVLSSLAFPYLVGCIFAIIHRLKKLTSVTEHKKNGPNV